MEFLSQTYTALRGPTGTHQNTDDAIRKLTDRLSQATMLPDRRASVMALKGLVRDFKTEVGEAAMPGLIEALLNDCEMDADMAKACLETFIALCEVEQSQQPGLKHTDYFLANPVAIHRLFDLLSSDSFYTQFGTLQLLGILLNNRKQVVQRFFISSPDGSGTSGMLKALNDKREIIRNEALGILQSLATQNVEIQKILAFAGTFDGLLSIISNEGGTDGGIIVQDSLNVLDLLLRLNVSNQTYFRETHLQNLLLLLLFPPELTLDSEYATPQEFALQFWNPQKTANTSSVVSLLSLFSKGNDSISSTIQRLLTELALASNAPTSVKIQAIRGLPSNPTSQLATLVLTPYAPVPQSNGEEWDRLDHTSALSALVDLVLDGEYASIGFESESRAIQALELRTAAAAMFENFVRREDVREAVLKGMIPDDPDAHPPRASIQILTALTSPPPQPLDFQFACRSHFACLLTASLVSQSSSAKTLARNIIPAASAAGAAEKAHLRNNSVGFFVPADTSPNAGIPDTLNEKQALVDEERSARVEDEDDNLTLMQIITEYMSLGFLLRSKMREDTGGAPGEERDWDRLLVGYIILIIRWLWDDPASIREFLDNRGIDILVEPINQPFGVDPVVKGLCAFLLGECYEFNSEPGSVSRSAIFQILGRLGSDAVVGAMSKVRADDCFRDLSPELTVSAFPISTLTTSIPSPEQDGEVWFDWAFVDFWKTNFYTIQRCVGLDPESLQTSTAGSAVANESTVLVSSLREKVSNQANEIGELKQKLATLSKQYDEQSDALHDQISQLSTELAESKEKQREAEKEQEDLLVFLDEMSSKRKRDKERLKALGQDVSDDEGDAEEEEEES